MPSHFLSRWTGMIWLRMERACSYWERRDESSGSIKCAEFFIRWRTFILSRRTMIRRVSLSNAYDSLICQSNCVFVQTMWETFILSEFICRWYWLLLNKVTVDCLCGVTRWNLQLVCLLFMVAGFHMKHPAVIRGVYWPFFTVLKLPVP